MCEQTSCRSDPVPGQCAAAEESARSASAIATASLDYGSIPVDLLQGRTHFEGRGKNGVLFAVNTGADGEGRVLMARIAVGVGAFGLILLAFRAFLKDKG